VLKKKEDTAERLSQERDTALGMERLAVAEARALDAERAVREERRQRLDLEKRIKEVHLSVIISVNPGISTHNPHNPKFNGSKEMDRRET